MAYLRQMRVERMARLLASTDLSIGDCARAVGWTNALCASRTFYAAYGLSPTEFRRRQPPPLA
jgi:transcriptional regulator GlxA family with amidase domain